MFALKAPYINFVNTKVYCLVRMYVFQSLRAFRRARNDKAFHDLLMVSNLPSRRKCYGLGQQCRRPITNYSMSMVMGGVYQLFMIQTYVYIWFRLVGAPFGFKPYAPYPNFHCTIRSLYRASGVGEGDRCRPYTSQESRGAIDISSLDRNLVLCLNVFNLPSALKGSSPDSAVALSCWRGHPPHLSLPPHIIQPTIHCQGRTFERDPFTT